MRTGQQTFVTMFLVTILASSVVWSEEKDKPEARIDFKRLAEIFEPPGVPGIRGKEWKEISIGASNLKETVKGWAVEESPTALTVRELNGNLRTFRKAANSAERPVISTERVGENDFFNRAELKAVDYSIAWEIETGDFLAESRAFLIQGMPKKVEKKGEFASGFPDTMAIIRTIVDGCRYAHHVQELGDHKLAAAVYALAEQASAEYQTSFIAGMPPRDEMLQFVVERVSTQLRHEAVMAGHGGTPRKQLLGLWARLSAIPNQGYQKQAAEMERLYRQLIEEDAKWEEPSKEAMERLTVDQKVDYWLYHLRDLDIGQNSDPGSCNVFRGFLNRGMHSSFDGEAPNAAEELRKLGRPAIPKLTAHLRDVRPTRCKEHWRSYWPDGHHLLTYGDCCRQILAAIPAESEARP